MNRAGGATSSDYSGVPESVTFVSGETAKTFTLTATQDTEDDDGEGVRLTFRNLPTGVSEGSIDETTVSITDDDDPSVTVSFASSNYTVSEGASTTISVRLSVDPERSVTVPLTVALLGSATSADYSGIPESVTFLSGETAKTFTLTATQDTEDDDGEGVRLTFRNLPTGVSEGSISETTVLITDDDDPSVSVSFGSAKYTAAEGSTISVAVKLSVDPERSLSIPLTIADLGGVTSADYSGVPASVTFTAEENEKTFTFVAHQDTDDDDGESVRLTFGKLSDGVVLGDHATTTVSIKDDDVPDVSVSFERGSYAVTEGATTTVSVVLSVAPERSVTIPLAATNQGGATGSDYRGLPPSVTFESGDTEREISFGAIQDSLDDDGESVRLTFGELPDGVTGGSASTTTISITDDDDPLVAVSFGASGYTVSEGASTTISVKLSVDPERSVTVPLTVALLGSATSADYSGIPVSVTFGSSETAKTFTLTATQDTEDDDGESVRLTFGEFPEGVTRGATSTTTISITDDDDPSVSVSFGASSYTVAEGSTTTISVRLSADPERRVVIPLVVALLGSATSADYSGIPESVSFDAEETEKDFVLSVTQDADDDDGEGVRVTFGGLPDGVTGGSASTTTISIKDDDDPSVSVSFGVSSYAVAEGATTSVAVRLSVDPERSLNIPLIIADLGGATSADYTGVPASLTFESGDTEKEFTFLATQDTEDDDGEGVRVTFGELPHNVTTGSVSTTTISIADDDVRKVTVSFEQDSYSVPEGSTTTVKVVLSADPERSVRISLTAVNVNGASTADYSGVPDTLTFESGDTEKEFTFLATQDTEDDDDESVTLGIGPSLPPV